MPLAAVERFACRIGALVLAAGLAAAVGANDFLPDAEDAARIEAAVAAERPAFNPPAGVTGIIVPHHLLAADLIARGFWAASAGEYDRIVLLAPDHFHLVSAAFGVGTGDRPTLFGDVPVDAAAGRRLLDRPSLFEAHRDIGAEHGVGAILPFVAHFFPGVPVVAVVASEHAGAEEWGAAVEALAPLVGDRTLVVQSTDYAHYLPAADAVLRDQETLAAIAEARPGRVAAMLQPAHMDAKAAQHMQMALQARLGAASAVVANRNSVEYGGDPASTTSYLVTVYHRDAGALSRLVYADQQVLHFGGDVLLGRHVQPLLGDAEAMAPMLQAARAATGGGALIVNLEGVLADAPIAGAPATSHLMHLGLAAPALRYLGVAAASVANNHAWDFGETGAGMTRRALAGIGVTPLPHGEIVDLGAARLLALNALPGRGPHLEGPGAAAALCRAEAEPPLVAFVHWGREGTGEAGEAERRLAAGLARCGVSVTLGAHSHVASTRVEVTGRMPWVYSLGNFLFDQSGDRATGAVAEVRVFRQGTIALRLIPLPNLFELGRAAVLAQ